MEENQSITVNSINYENIHELKQNNDINSNEIIAINRNNLNDTKLQYLSIHQLNLWKNKNIISYPIDNVLNDYLDNRNILTKKRPRDIAIENANKAGYELSNLWSMIKLLQTSNNQVIKPYPHIGLIKNNAISYNVSDYYDRYSDKYKNIHSIISNGLKLTNEVTNYNNKIINQLIELSKYWRLSTRSSDKFRSIELNEIYNNKFELYDNIYIDCSLQSCNDNNSSIHEYLVELTINPSTHQYYINDIELNRVLYNINFSIYISNYLVLQKQLKKAFFQTENINFINANLLVIHNYCTNRLIDCYNKRLFYYLKNDLLKKNIYRYINKVDGTSISLSIDELSDILVNEDISSEILIQSIDRNKLTILLSTNIKLNIELKPTTETYNDISNYLPINLINSGIYLMDILLASYLSNRIDKNVNTIHDSTKQPINSKLFVNKIDLMLRSSYPLNTIDNTVSCELIVPLINIIKFNLYNYIFNYLTNKNNLLINHAISYSSSYTKIIGELFTDYLLGDTTSNSGLDSQIDSKLGEYINVKLLSDKCQLIINDNDKSIHVSITNDGFNITTKISKYEHLPSYVINSSNLLNYPLTVSYSKVSEVWNYLSIVLKDK